MIEKIKNRLSEAIRQSGMTHKTIAEELGVSRSLITQYYKKRKLPRLETLAQLCIILDESPNYILCFVE